MQRTHNPLSLGSNPSGPTKFKISSSMKYAAIILLIILSSVSKSAEIDYWQGLEYDYSNATAYHINFSSEKVDLGVIAVTSQLYSYGDGRYLTIPQNVSLSVNKVITKENYSLSIGMLYWANESIIFKDKLNYQFVVNYKIKNNVKLNVEHYGLTSITKSDAGLNKVSVYWTF